MTIQNFSEHKTESSADVGVWHCEKCASFHIKAGDVLLTFTRPEFGSFSNAVLDTYSASITMEEALDFAALPFKSRETELVH